MEAGLVFRGRAPVLVTPVHVIPTLPFLSLQPLRSDESGQFGEISATDERLGTAETGQNRGLEVSLTDRLRFDGVWMHALSREVLILMAKRPIASRQRRSNARSRVTLHEYAD